jgi:diazepam-binding inhibitor (GABA receptor modulator, acyl-CoA-binding protein)
LAFVKSLPPERIALNYSATSRSPNLDNETKLLFYAYFKQATNGPNNTKAPSRLKVVDRYKWDAWKKLGKMSKEDAMKKYVERLNTIAPDWKNEKAKL